MLLSIIISSGLLFADSPTDLAEQSSDTLCAVTVTADKGVVISRTDTLRIRNTFDITDVLHQVPGLQLGDYGGLAGLKTVSLRGMGSPHTTVYVDGVRVGNVQSGQGDMGMLEIENFSSALVDYAQNSISFITSRPTFGKNRVAGKAGIKVGSFGTYLPEARVDLKLSDKVALSVNAAGIISRGDFPIADGGRRENNDIMQIRGGLNLFGSMPDGDYHVKAFYNTAERGTPGAVTWPSEDRQKDMNAYLQGVIRKKFSPLYTISLSAKAGYDDIYYTSSWGDSEYGQTELQLNSSHVFSISSWWNLSVAADIQWDRLASTNYYASRTTAIYALSTSFKLNRLSLNAAAEYSGYFDRGQLSRHAISPSVDFRVRTIDGLDIVGFARRAYRVPMFNELYYVGYGNPDLKPEDAWMTDLGVDFHRPLSRAWNLKAKIDGFCNVLKNKITSAQTEEDPNIWLPYNIGKVRSIGLDIVTGADFTYGEWTGVMDIRYSCQSAVDLTPDSYSYGQQIPYIAKHNVTASVRTSWKGYELTPQWILKSGRSDSAGKLADWNTLDLTLSKTFDIKGTLSLGIRVSARNLLDCRYELVSGYPMPGRSWIAGIEMKF